MSKIALNMIVRNCADFIEKALNSTKGQVDYYIIGFGGESKDQTENIVKNWLETTLPPNTWATHSLGWNEDFSEARNKILKATYQDFSDAGWMFWMDADDELITKENLHDIADKYMGGGCVQFPYLYQRDEKGKVIVWHARERLVYLPLNWYWKDPVHETLHTPSKHTIIYIDKVGILHNAEISSDNRSERNKRILFRQLEKEPNNRRVKLYLAHCFYSNQDYEEGLKWFGEYFYNPENDVEQWSAAVFAARCALSLGKFEECSGWAHHAIDIRPEWKDGWLLLGEAHTRLQNYDAAVSFFKESDTKEKPPPLLFIVENEYGYNRWCYEHEALAATNRTQEALEICEKALKENSDHHGFRYYYFGYKEILDAAKSLEAIKQLCMTLLRRGDGLKALRLLDTCVPVNISEEEEILKLKEFVYSCIEQIWDINILNYMNEEGNRLGAESDIGAPKKDTYEVIETFSRVSAVVKLLEPHIKNGTKKIIDLACAGGGITMYLAEKFPETEFVGVDSEEKSVKTANERANLWGLSERVKFIQSNLFDIKNPIQEYDIALLQEIIEHTDKPGVFIDIALQLAPTVIITTPHQLVVAPNLGQIKNPKNNAPLHHHVIEFSRQDLERLGLFNGRIDNLFDVYDKESITPGFGSWVMEITKEKTDFKPPIVIYTGESGGEIWDAHSINENGLGGSETAAIKIAEEFANRGHITFLYGTKDGVYNKVIYRKASKFNPEHPAGNTKAWLFVGSRVPWIVDSNINADIKILWCHDNTYYDQLTEERANKFDYIFVLSEWAKRFMKKQYPFLDNNKLVVTNNGITSENFSLNGINRNKHSFIYASSADRGLERILDLWPKIKKEWKDAELDIYYGMDVMKKMWGHDPNVQEFMERIQIKADSQKGVNFKGRIGQAELAKEFQSHQYWLYPTAFEETFCITALEAQAGGCIPLTTNVGALKERVPDEYRLDWKNGTEFISKLKELDKLEKLPSKYVKAAKEYTWDKVADQWLKVVMENGKK